MQQYAGVYLLQNYSTCLGCLSHPSSGVHQTVTAASGTGYNVRATTFRQRVLIRTAYLYIIYVIYRHKLLCFKTALPLSIFDPMVIKLLDLIKIRHFSLALRHSSIHNVRTFRHNFISDNSSAIPNVRAAVDDRVECASTALGYPHFNVDTHS